MSKEMNQLRLEQEAKEAAALKAKLDLVELRDKPPYGRCPRKIGEMVCDTGIRNGYREATAKFVLRLDQHSGEFIAEHGDFWYVSKSRDALKAKMDQVAKITLDLKWTRYLHVEYKATIKSERWSSEEELDIDEPRRKRPVYGIKLTWEIVEYSDSLRLPGDDDDRYMKRDVDKNGKPEVRQDSVVRMPAGLVPYTKEREQLLRDVQLAFASIDQKMLAMLTGTPDEIAKQLDAANGQLLLAAPPKKGPRR